MRHNCWSRRVLEPLLHDKRSHCNEKPEHRSQNNPRSLQLEKVCTQQVRPSAAKNKLINLKKTSAWCMYIKGLK